MTIAELQQAVSTPADGQWGPASKAALLAFFVNTSAPAVGPAEIAAFAARLGCSPAQLAAVGEVESSKSGFDGSGRPKILFERHFFHRLTDGRWSPAIFSDPTPGGYSVSSWDKLAAACGRAPDAAFASASWGKFQVMGAHWHVLGYASPFELAASMRAGEVAHYELLARFIEANGLADELRRLSADPEDCRAFARAYNGSGYERFAYHTKLAERMA
jgi:hypothetical protein